jgi:thiol-disulfide isomerase/thioredoxin
LWVEDQRSIVATKKPSNQRPNAARPPARGARGGRPAGLFTWLAVGLVVVVVAALVIIKVASGSGTPSTDSSTWQAASPTTVAQLTSVPASVFNTVGTTSPIAQVTPPQVPLKKLPLLTATDANGKTVPEVLYMGAEYCPYCAAQRWSTIIALSRFGKFSGLGNMSSYSGDVYPNTPTFTFLKAKYTSSYVVFKTVELYTNYLNAAKSFYATLQKPTTQEEMEITKYDTDKYITGLTASTAGSIPFLSFGNKYLVSGSSYSPTTLAGSTRAEIAAALDNPTSPVTQAIIASANYQTAAICSLTKGQPGNVCSSSGVMAAAKAMSIK